MNKRNKESPCPYGIYILECVESRQQINKMNYMACQIQSSMKTNKSAKVVRDAEIIYVCVSHCTVLEERRSGPQVQRGTLRSRPFHSAATCPLGAQGALGCLNPRLPQPRSPNQPPRSEGPRKSRQGFYRIPDHPSDPCQLRPS